MTDKARSTSEAFLVTATERSTARTEAPTLTAGRALDALVAEKVMGLSHVRTDHPTNRGYSTEPSYGRSGIGVVPHYSTSIADAWEVFDRLGGIYTISGYTREGVREWRVQISYAECQWASTAPHAICLAALKAVSVLSQTEEGK